MPLSPEQLVDVARSRYTTKAFDPAFRIDDATIDALLETLRLSASSVNSQPWHFVVATSDDGKARIAATLEDGYAYNAAKVKNASHVIALCVRTGIDDAYLDTLLAQDQAAGRFADDAARAGQAKSRLMYVDLHRKTRGDLRHWMEKQVYLALGSLLYAAAAAGIDAAPMEGIDHDAIDAALGLGEQGYASVVLLALGRRSASDFNARLPKSRLSAERVLTHI
ncbi:oxygen-insensitive NAD(P)H nitroreductase [Solimonas marina]|uniref:Oxygen-insensitive NAD(P)H nitroreductase n=1 Tax=Solimonas marina TaxID=2714601 RepID=A0A969W7E9_9GAMM|nr:oxygen-insensitive NAD(P)H nitroreductase [Solimonas marina]NKF20965.1 oxygen-insensitive NAD(P)H nitroreductase [Solimonas marina]